MSTTADYPIPIPLSFSSFSFSLSLCYRWFVSEFLEAVEFVPARNSIHLDRGLPGIPVRKAVCSRKCFEDVSCARCAMVLHIGRCQLVVVERKEIVRRPFS